MPRKSESEDNPPPLRRSSRLSAGSPVPTKMITRRASTESNISTNTTNSTQRVTRARRLSLNQENTPSETTTKSPRKMEVKSESNSPQMRRTTKRYSISLVNSEPKVENKRVTRRSVSRNEIKSPVSSPVKENVKTLEAIKEDIQEELEEKTTEVTTKRKRGASQINLSVIKEEDQNENKITNGVIKKELENIQNVSVKVVDIIKTSPSSSPAKSPTVNINGEEGKLTNGSIDGENSNLNSSKRSSTPKKIKQETSEKTKTPELRKSPRIQEVNACSTPIETVKKDLFNDTDKALTQKLNDLVGNVMEESSSDEENDNKPKHFLIDDMAEEGEEDTPSEGSNDIIDVGEEINTTASSFSNDESYKSDSFVDKDENIDALLSGTEYDLSFEDLKKQEEIVKNSRSRIIGLSSSSDDDDNNKVVIIERRKKMEKKRKSRIIQQPDSSEDDESSDETSNGVNKEIEVTSTEIKTVETEGVTSGNEDGNTSKKCNSVVILQNIRIDNVSNKRLSDHIQQVVDDVRPEIPVKGEVSLNVTLDYFENNVCLEGNKSKNASIQNEKEESCVESKETSIGNLEEGENCKELLNSESNSKKKNRRSKLKNVITESENEKSVNDSTLNLSGDKSKIDEDNMNGSSNLALQKKSETSELEKSVLETMDSSICIEEINLLEENKEETSIKVEEPNEKSEEKNKKKKKRLKSGRESGTDASNDESLDLTSNNSPCEENLETNQIQKSENGENSESNDKIESINLLDDDKEEIDLETPVSIEVSNNDSRRKNKKKRKRSKSGTESGTDASKDESSLTLNGSEEKLLKTSQTEISKVEENIDTSVQIETIILEENKDTILIDNELESTDVSQRKNKKKRKRSKSKTESSINISQDATIDTFVEIQTINLIEKNEEPLSINLENKSDEQCNGQETSNKKKKKKRSKSKKRKREAEEAEQSLSKKPKINDFTSYKTPTIKTTSVLDDAATAQRNQMKIRPSNSIVPDNWNVKHKKVKPSKQQDKMEDVIVKSLDKKVKEKKAKHINVNQNFHVKDFKNAMLYDANRNRRVETKQVLSKKGVYFN